eukprot:719460-Rhodomonas_salina.3
MARPTTSTPRSDGTSSDMRPTTIAMKGRDSGTPANYLRRHLVPWLLSCLVDPLPRQQAFQHLPAPHPVSASTDFNTSNPLSNVRY